MHKTVQASFAHMVAGRHRAPTSLYVDAPVADVLISLSKTARHLRSCAGHSHSWEGEGGGSHPFHLRVTPESCTHQGYSHPTGQAYSQGRTWRMRGWETAPLFWVVMCPAIIWGFVTKEKKRESRGGGTASYLCLSNDFLKMQLLWVI